MSDRATDLAVLMEREDEFENVQAHTDSVVLETKDTNALFSFARENARGPFAVRELDWNTYRIEFGS